MVAQSKEDRLTPVGEELARMLRHSRVPSRQPDVQANPLAKEWRRFFELARPRRRRSMLEFAEQEIVIPDGKYKGEQFLADTQPFMRLWLNEVDSGRWRRHVTTGPRQSGKTLLCFVIDLLYHLFEIGETVICLVPDMNIAWDKWREDIEPAIKASRYADLLPDTGPGSRGGKVEAIKFLNGPTLKFMSGGGGDRRRQAFTSRVLMVTEVEDLDEAGTASREADKITQAEHCTDSFGSDRRIFLESTLTTKQGRTWREYQQSTKSRVALKCPHCESWVSPEREHFTGWSEADNIIDAMAQARWCCPECGSGWTDEEREEANSRCRLLHDGQTIDEDGEIVGDVPKTDTFGFRWTATNNMFWDSGEVAAFEWRGARAEDEQNAEKELCQFVWAVPYEPPDLDTVPLEIKVITERTTNEPRGTVPSNVAQVAVGIDVGKYLSYWLCVGFRGQATPHVVDYGVIEVPSRSMAFERAIQAALSGFRDQFCEPGWASADGRRRCPDQVWIDARWQGGNKGSYPIYAFTQASGLRYMPALGFGTGQQYVRAYWRPKERSAEIAVIGEGYHIRRQRSPRVNVVHVDADFWKSWAHERWSTPLGTPGAATLFHAEPHEHLTFAKHLTAEEQRTEFKPKHGMVTVWVRKNRANHFLDAYSLACAAGHYAGARLIDDPQPGQSRPVTLSEHFAKQKMQRGIRR